MYYQIRNKYNAQRTDYNGRSFRSKLEAGHAQYLDLLIKAGEVDHWDYEDKLDLRVYDKHICYYRIDFTVYYTDGHKEYQETKGFETDAWINKWKLFEAIMNHDEPDTKLVVIKENYNYFKNIRR